MSSVVVIDCNDISSSRKLTLMELYQALAPVPDSDSLCYWRYSSPLV